MLDYILDLFGSAQFVPHAVCLLWRPDLLIMHGLSDLAIAAAYLTIPLIILKAVKRRPDLLDARVARLFAAFILACALSHLSGLITLWYPAYALQGLVKLMTAAVSIYTAMQLARLLPEFLTMPSRKEMALKEAEVELQHRLRAETQELNERLDEFAYVASHDLKAPLRGIATQAGFLTREIGADLKPETQRRLDRMQELCRHLDTLITTLLRFARLGQAESIETVDPAKVVEEISASLAETLDAENARIEIEMELPLIEANPSEVATVFRNLILNGLIYNDSAEKQIGIGFHEVAVVDGARVTQAFYVRDNGIGIEEHHKENVFRMFKRLHPNDRYASGTGAGLSFVRKVVEGSGGVIRLDSEPGHGSTFYFSFEQQGLRDAPLEAGPGAPRFS